MLIVKTHKHSTIGHVGQVLCSMVVLLLGAIVLSSSCPNGQSATATDEKEKTRMLVVLDCSASMWQRWDSDAKIKVVQQTLLSFFDSISDNRDVEIALRVFGHMNNHAYSSQLLVPFSADNIYALRSKVKTLVPFDSNTSISNTISSSLYDFPQQVAARNIILIISDGIDDRNSEICNVANSVLAESGITYTFFIGIGEADFQNTEHCVGSLLTVRKEENLLPIMSHIFRLAGKKAKVLLNIRTTDGDLVDATLPLGWTTGERGLGGSFLPSVYSPAVGGTDDTILLDPLLPYSLTIYSTPAVVVRNIDLSVDSINNIDVTLPLGSLRVGFNIRQSSWVAKAKNVRVHSESNRQYLAATTTGESIELVEGEYTIEVATTPPVTIHNVKIREGATTDITLPAEGNLQISKPKGLHYGYIIAIEKEGSRLAYTLDANLINEKVPLQPGLYEVVLQKEGSQSHRSVLSKRFVIESTKTTKVDF